MLPRSGRARERSTSSATNWMSVGNYGCVFDKWRPSEVYQSGRNNATFDQAMHISVDDESSTYDMVSCQFGNNDGHHRHQRNFFFFFLFSILLYFFWPSIIK